MKTMNKYLRCLTLFVLILGVSLFCTSCRTTLKSTSPSYPEIAEVVIRYIAQPNERVDEESHNLNLVHKVYFIQIDGQDPSPEFLSRLQNLNVPVKPLSSSVLRGAYRYDVKSGERGAVFHIINIQVIGWNRAIADVGLAPGGWLTASESAYRLIRKHGKWVVVSEKIIRIA